MREFARLVGGPCDGRLVEIAGTVWKFCLCRRTRRGRAVASFYHATYPWDFDDEGNLIGVGS